jgi:sugar/nucleoside kinase (ribokinase family)
MNQATLSRERLEELLKGFPKSRIAVVGDFFLDKYLEVNPAWDEPSLETGKVAHQVAAIRVSPGAAGTVVSNLQALGAGELHAIGFTGDDGEGYELRRALERLGCTTNHLPTMPGRFTPTYLKPRDMTLSGLEGEHSRYDTKNRTPTPKAIEERTLASLGALLPRVDALVILDQVEQENCGVITKTVRESLSQLAPKHPRVVFWADSRRRIRQFQNVMIKPNQFEALGLDSPKEGDSIPLEVLLPHAAEIRGQTKAPLYITRGSQGVLVYDGDATLIPGIKITAPIDPTGAGDSFTAGSVLALCAGASLSEAAIIGTLVASLTVLQLSTTGTAKPEQLPPRLDEWLAQAQTLE